MTLRLDEPWWLVTLTLLVPTTIVALRWFSGMTEARKWSAVFLRGVLMLTLVGMIAGASMVRSTDRQAVVALVDESGSVRRFVKPGVDASGKPVPTSDAVRGFLERSTGARRPDDVSGVVTFGAAPSVASPIGQGFGFPTDASTTEGTDIAKAIQLGAAMLPPGVSSRLVLFSDGVGTAGDAVRAAKAAGVPIDVVPLAYRVEREVMVESIDTPPTAPAGSTVSVRVVLSSAGESAGTLRILHEGTPVAFDDGRTSMSLTLAPGQTVRQVSVPLGDGRVHRFEAVWEPDGPDADAIATNNRASSFTIAPGKGSILIVDGVSGGEPSGPGATLARALRGAGMSVEVTAPEGLRSEMLWLQAFDLIILQNVAADAVPVETQRAIVGYVTQLGGGLVMLGGPTSFGAGGWKGSEIEPILPVKLDLPERAVVPSMAVVMVIDNSGSMNRTVLGSDRTQQEIANQGAASAVLSMDKTDLIGVIAFNTDYTVEVPLGPNADPNGTARRIRGIGADGGTLLPPALEEAGRQLKRSDAEVKHIIVLTDGVSMGAEQLAPMSARLAKEGVKITTIAVGDDADTNVLAEMAKIGQGQFYRVIDPTVLPRIFLRAVRIVRSPLIRESPFVPSVVGAGSPVLEGVASLPPLNGLVLTQPRDEATVVDVLATTGMRALGGKSDARVSSGVSDVEPVLSYWSAGLGRVGAFTSDAHDWAREWVAADDGMYAKFWSQLVRTIARPPTSRTQVLTLDATGDRIHARLDASTDDGRPLDLLDVPASVYTPRGERIDLRLSQVGPGEYEGTMRPGAGGASSEPGVYVVTLMPRQGTRALAPVIGGVTRPAGAEFRRLTSDRAALEAIAQASGGRVLDLAKPEDAKLFARDDGRAAIIRTPLWRLLALWAIAVMLLDVATRRIAWDRLIARSFGRDLKRLAMDTIKERGGQAERSVSVLRKRDKELEAAHETRQTPGALSEADAAAIVQAERLRRAIAREAARRAASASVAEQAPAPIVDESASAGEPEPDDGGLLAAKRRAKKKMDDRSSGA